MAAKFNQNIRSFSCNSFVNTLQSKSPEVWTPNTIYTLGAVRIYGTNKYSVLSSGLSGVTPPTHINGALSDGGLNWLFIEVITRDNTYVGNMFLAFGKSTPWGNEVSPDIPDVSYLGDASTLNDLITLKNISSSNARIAAPRNDWTSGIIYTQFNPALDIFNVNSYPTPFYVVTDELKVYKCLDNNYGSPSVAKPISTGVNPVVLADGYCWKYMATISSQDAASFVTNDFIPTKYIIQNDGSDQWNVQQAAQVNGISTFKIMQQVGSFNATNVLINGVGSNVVVNVIKNTNNNSISQVIALESGTGYDSDTFAIIKENGVSGSAATATTTIVGGVITSITVNTVGTNYVEAIAIVVGDGTGASAAVTISVSGTVNSVAVISGGSGYTWAKVFIIPGVSGCVARGVLSPYNGHGHNMVSELGATAVLLSIRVEANAHLLTGTGSESRQVVILTDILDADNNPAYLNYYIGPGHPEYTNSGSTLHKIKKGSGYVLYLSNILVKTRSASQEEHIKLAILF